MNWKSVKFHSAKNDSRLQKYSTVQYSSVQFSTAQHSTVQ